MFSARSRWWTACALVAVLVVQCIADLIPAAIYERTVNATPLRPLVGVLATVYGFDVLLTPIGMLAAAEGGFAFLALLPFTTSCIPPGFVWKLRTTVRGSSRTVFVSVRPPESVAVSFSSR